MSQARELPRPVGVRPVPLRALADPDTQLAGPEVEVTGVPQEVRISRGA